MQTGNCWKRGKLNKPTPKLLKGKTVSPNLNKLFLLPILFVMSGCAHGLTARPVVVSDYCQIAKPITYDRKADSEATVSQVEAHNSKWVCVCEDDCPQPTLRNLVAPLTGS